MNALRIFIALTVLRLLFPQGMRRASTVVVLPLRGSMKTEMSRYGLSGLFLDPQIVLDPAHPSPFCSDLWRELGGRPLHIAKRSPDLKTVTENIPNLTARATQ